MVTIWVIIMAILILAIAVMGYQSETAHEKFVQSWDDNAYKHNSENPNKERVKYYHEV